MLDPDDNPPLTEAEAVLWLMEQGCEDLSPRMVAVVLCFPASALARARVNMHGAAWGMFLPVYVGAGIGRGVYIWPSAHPTLTDVAVLSIIVPLGKVNTQKKQRWAELDGGPHRCGTHRALCAALTLDPAVGTRLVFDPRAFIAAPALVRLTARKSSA